MKKVLQIMILLVSVFVLVACGDKTPDLTIDAPKNVEINGDVLSWSAVSGADSYLVYIDTRSVEVNGTSFNLANEPMTVGEHVISVVAVKGDGFSIPSAVLTYTVAILANPANIASSVITSIDSSYETGMDQSDFPNEWEYENYLDAMAMVEAYAEATANVRMTEANAIGFFNDFKDMTSSDIQTLDDLMDEMEMFDTYNMTPYATAYVLYNVALVGMDQGMDQEVMEAFEDNEELVVQSLEMVLDFLMTVKNSIPANVITTIDGAVASEEITNAEIFLIKDEMITILQANLPSVADFTILYTTLFHVGGAITGENMTSYVAHASYLAEVNHLEFELVLGMLDAITLVNINEIEDLVNDIYVEVYIPEWDDYYSETDSKKVVELILYIATFVDDFKTANTAMFDELDALMQDDSAEALYGIAIDNMIAQIQADLEIPATEKVEIIAMLNEFKGEYDTIMAAQAIIKEIGLGVFEEFVDSEASLIMNILSLNDTEDMTQAEITALINSIIDDAISLNGIVMNELDQAAFQTLLDFIKIPLMLQLPAMYMMMDMEDIDYEDMYDALSPFIAELLANAVVLEKAIINALDTVDVASLFEGSGMGMSMILTPALDVLNTALTPANEALIMASIDIIFDDIMKNADILSLTSLTSGDIDAVKSEIVDQAEFLIDEIQVISTWDLTDLTTAEQERVEALLAILEDLFATQSSDMFSNAYPIYLDDKNQFYMNEDGVQYFEFIPETSGYHIIFSHYYFGDYNYPELVVFNYDGEEIYWDSFSNQNQKIYFAANEVYLRGDEVYYIGIFGGSELPFTIQIRNAYVEGPSPFDSATPIYLNQEVYTYFDMVFEPEFFVFTPLVDGLYDIYSSATNGADPYLMLFEDNNGYMERIDSFDDEGSNGNFYVNDYFLRSGYTYYLAVSSFAIDTRPYTFIITNADAGEPDPVTSPFEDAIPVVAGQTVTATVMPDQKIYYIFTPTVSGSYDIYSTIPDDNIDPLLYILDAYGTYMMEFDDEGPDWNFYASEIYFQAGVTYYFELSTYDDVTSTFSFVISNPY